MGQPPNVDLSQESRNWAYLGEDSRPLQEEQGIVQNRSQRTSNWGYMKRWQPEVGPWTNLMKNVCLAGVCQLNIWRNSGELVRMIASPLRLLLNLSSGNRSPGVEENAG